MSEQRDYSLLRPFDLEAAKRGEPMFLQLNNGAFNDIPRTHLAGPDDLGKVCFSVNDGLLDIAHKSDLRMAPLCWVEGRPVYRGDVLYHPKHGEGKVIEDRRYCGGAAIKYEAAGTGVAIEAPYFYDGLTWTPPQTVKRQVKLLAYLDADQLFWLRETAQPKWPATRVPLEDRTVEIEEPLEQAA